MAECSLDEIYAEFRKSLRNRLADPRTRMLLAEHPANFITGFFVDTAAVALTDSEDDSETVTAVHKRFLEWTDEPTTINHFKTLLLGMKKTLSDLGLKIQGNRVLGLKLLGDSLEDYDALPSFVRDKCTLTKDAETPSKAFVEALRAYERDHPDLKPVYERTLKNWRFSKWNMDLHCGCVFNVLLAD